MKLKPSTYNYLLWLIALFTVSFSLLLSCKDTPPSDEPIPDPEPEPIPVVELRFIRACDLSFLPEIRKSGITCYNLENKEEDMLVTLQQAGMNVVRLRVWNNPPDGRSSLEEVRQFAEEIHEKKLKVWLTLHYSDTWADPGSQTKPSLWNNLPFNLLKDSVFKSTKTVMSAIKPDYIQIGNEINNGMLWPEGSLGYLNQLTGLLSEGIRAVRETDTTTQIMLHYAGFQGSEDFFSKMNTLDYDLIGLSYYPKWHGKDLDQLQLTLSNLSTTFDQELVIAETSYAFSLGWNDWTNNVIGSQDELLAAYPASEQGQKDFLLKIRELIAATHRGKGFAYWGGEWIAFKGSTASDGSSWENQALWDFNNQTLEAVKAFADTIVSQ